MSTLALESIGAVLVPATIAPSKHGHADPDHRTPSIWNQADPLAPAYPLNGAKIASRLTRKPAGARTVLVLRPCEIRAFFELVKFNQGGMEEVVILGMDCLGAFRNT